MATVIGTSGNDSNLQGTTNSDLILGFQGQDSIIGNGGNDTLYGGQGADSITFGIAPPFTLNEPGANGASLVFGGEGMDTITSQGGSGSNTFVSRTGNSFIHNTADGADFIDTRDDTGNDLILGNVGDDTILARGASDTLFGGQGDDFLFQGFTTEANEVVFGGQGADTIIADANGSNSIIGGTGSALIDATSDGADLITITNSTNTAASDLVVGGYGDDSIFSSFPGFIGDTDTLVGGQGNDFFEVSGDTNGIILGNQGNDVILDAFFDAGTDTLYGGMGDDSITTGSDTVGANALVYGGEGNDVILVQGTENNTVFGGVDSIGSGDGNNLISIDNQTDGNDLLFGGSGNDSISTGFSTATDTVTGGAGADTFSYTGTVGATGTGSAYGTSAPAGLDVINDFVSGTDKIADQTVPGVLGNFGGPVANAVVLNATVAGAGAAEAAASFLGGGSGAVNAVLFQTVTGGDHYLVVDNDASGSFTNGDLLVDLKAATSIAKSDFV